MSKESDLPPSHPVPWGRLLWWNTLFGSLYLFRLVSIDIWLASRKADAEFGELKFGETTLTTVRRILSAVPMTMDSIVYDLGCGRGRAAFMFHFLSGAKVVAIDLVGPFIVTARRLARWTGCSDQVLFCYENFLQSDFEEADVIYACALCFSDSTREALLEKIARCKPGTHIVTVGWNPRSDLLIPVEEFRSGFSWGSAKVYIKRVAGGPKISAN